MTERQDEILVKGVEQAEAEVVVVVFAVDRIRRHVPQRVVHPPHVPFEAKAEPADISRARHHRPSGRFLGHWDAPASPNTSSFILRRNAIASRFSRPPKAF